MKNSIKKFLLTILSVSFAVSAFGCGASDNDSSKITNSSSVVDAEQSSEVDSQDSNKEASVDDFAYYLSDDGTFYGVGVGYDGEVVDFMNGEGAEIYNIPSEYEGLPVTKIEDVAFRMNNNVKEIIVPESVTEIGMGAFSLCENLEKIDFGKGVTKIGKELCNNDTSLKEVIFDCKVSEIPVLAFGGCSTLETITLNENVTTIGENAFQGCASLKEVHMTASVVEIYGAGTEKNVFDQCDALTIYAPAGSYAERYAKEKGILFVAE